MQVHFYYDFTPDRQHTNDTDPDGCLVQLCDECASRFRNEVELASLGDVDAECESCGYQIEGYKATMRNARIDFAVGR